MKEPRYIPLQTLQLLRRHPLSRGCVFSRIGRYLRWQISCRLWPGKRVVDVTDRCRMVVGRSMQGATGNVYFGLHEFADMGFTLHLLRPDDLFIDIGANVGIYTLLASGHVGCETLTFEPIATTFSALQDNVAINSLNDKVKLHQQGIGSETQTLTFTNDRDAQNHVVVNDSLRSDSSKIQVVPLDSVCAAKIPTLVKIDVEGYETEVIRGAQATLANPEVKAILIELTGYGSRYGFDESKVIESLCEMGFRPAIYSPLNRKLEVMSEAEIGGNTLFVRDEQWVRRRVTTSEPTRGWWGEI